jgi:dipeptidyl aminopeptidase/acylaminoacyl peptidase
VLNMAGRNPAESTAKKPATLSILTLSTGRVRVLRAEYPQIFTDYPVPNWDQWGVTVYDTSLTRVVYAYDSLERFDAGFTLWDVPNKRALATVPATSLINTPRWSPDGSRFVVAANTGTEAGWLSFELYSAGRDGDVQRLTYLTEHYAKVFIQNYTWSPDGRWIAFWLVADPEGVPFIEHGQAQLALLDTTTGQVTNTCLPGEHDASAAPARVPPPLWSPDSRQLVLENSTADGKSRVILVDLASGVAAVIAENVRPEGWMLGP